MTIIASISSRRGRRLDEISLSARARNILRSLGHSEGGSLGGEKTHIGVKGVRGFGGLSEPPITQVAKIDEIWRSLLELRDQALAGEAKGRRLPTGMGALAELMTVRDGLKEVARLVAEINVDRDFSLPSDERQNFAQYRRILRTSRVQAMEGLADYIDLATGRSDRFMPVRLGLKLRAALTILNRASWYDSIPTLALLDQSKTVQGLPFLLLDAVGVTVVNAMTAVRLRHPYISEEHFKDQVNLGVSYPDRRTVRLTVRDRGVGMTRGAVDVLFDYKPGRTGTGVHSLVETVLFLGGGVEVVTRRTGENRGTTFMIDLPKA